MLLLLFLLLLLLISFKTIQKNCFHKCRLTQFSGSGDDFPHIKSEIRCVATAQSTTVVPFPQRAFTLRSSGADRRALLVYKQALSYFPILSHSCSIQHSAGCHVRAGNAGFIKRGRVDRGGSPALREMMIKVGLAGALHVCRSVED